jgi:hypothetical protein
MPRAQGKPGEKSVYRDIRQPHGVKLPNRPFYPPVFLEHRRYIFLKIKILQFLIGSNIINFRLLALKAKALVSLRQQIAFISVAQ